MNPARLVFAALLASALVGPAYSALPGGSSSSPPDAPDPLAPPPLLEPGACQPGPDAPCPTGEEAPNRPEAESPAPPVKSAPAFTLNDLSGKPFRFEPRPGMKPTLLIFWSTFCGSCQEEMPVFSQISERYQGTRFQVLSIDVLPPEARLDEAKRRQMVRGYFDQNRIRMPVVFDRRAGKDYVAAGAYRVTGTPTLFLIGRDGVVRWTRSGRVEPQVLEAEIKKVISNQ
ncbi:MAG: TlpA family protein disulfide reductase [Deltaproteobacteria bacterium]|nr:TlpA family protein disulfide reductase [Deltaproteobacteria bacterium]